MFPRTYLSYLHYIIVYCLSPVVFIYYTEEKVYGFHMKVTSTLRGKGIQYDICTHLRCSLLATILKSGLINVLHLNNISDHKLSNKYDQTSLKHGSKVGFFPNITQVIFIVGVVVEIRWLSAILHGFLGLHCSRGIMIYKYGLDGH